MKPRQVETGLAYCTDGSQAVMSCIPKPKRKSPAASQVESEANGFKVLMGGEVESKSRKTKVLSLARLKQQGFWMFLGKLIFICSF